MPRKSAGFSLVELIVVMAVIAAITAIVVPSLSGTTDAAKMQRAIAVAQSFNMAQVSYRVEYGTASWPGAGDQAGCYSAILSYLQYPEATLSAVNTQLSPFSIEFQSVTGGKFQKVRIKKGTDYIDY